eukprot:Em0023g66a
MNKDPTWTLAAQQVLEETNDVWLSIPHIAKRIREQEIKQLHEISHDQACRRLRSCMMPDSRKEDGLFVRRESKVAADHTSVAYALRQRVRNPSSIKSPCLSVADFEETSDCVEDQSNNNVAISRNTLTVEIDPCLCLTKGLKKLDGMPGHCIPSPQERLLGPRCFRNGGPRHFYNTRKDQIDETGEELSSGRNGTLTQLNNLDGKHEYSVVAHQSEVVFLDLGSEGDPRCTQGSRYAVEHLHICPEETASRPDNQVPVIVQHTPTTQLLKRPSFAHITSSSYDSASEQGEEDLLCREQSPVQAVKARSTHSRTNKPPDQTHCLPVLFSSVSPLIEENLKNLLNMNTFEKLTSAQQHTLMGLLPAVDRGGSPSQSSFTHEFFSSSLREWQERLLQGANTVDYKARVKQEDRKRLRLEDPWKRLYYERYWGERSSPTPEDSSPPYYPVTEAALPADQLSCLQAIRKGRQSCKELSEHHRVSSSSIHTTTTTTTITPSNTNIPLIVKPDKNHIINCVKRSTPVKPSRGTKHMLKNISSKKLKKVLQLEQDTKSAMLTSLPPKTSYQSLLTALHQACKEPSSLPASSLDAFVPSPCHHEHCVFHDHFSTLSAQHVPLEFSDPVTSLPVSIPRELHTRHMLTQVVTREHSYAERTQSQPLSFKLSVPRSLLTGACVCDGVALLFCAQCHSMYHASCTLGSLCPACART